MPEIGITVAGRRFTGWKEAVVLRSMENAAGGFELRAAETEPDDPVARSFAPGLRCTVDLDGDTVITGWIDDVSVDWSGREHSIALRGRDAAGDLVDCAAGAVAKSWSNRRLQDIAAEICEPFGVAVRAEADTGKPFGYKDIKDSESAFQAIERLCRYRAVLPVSDGLGALVLTRAGTVRAAGRLAYGENLLSGGFEASWRDRFSTYILRGQQDMQESWSTAASTEPAAAAADPAVTRYRPLVILADPGDGAAYAERARWEASVRAGRSRRGAYQVAGWRDAAGALWRPNTLVQVRDPFAGVDAELLLASVEYSIGREGTRATLHVLHPSAFALIALPEPEEDALWTR